MHPRTLLALVLLAAPAAAQLPFVETFDNASNVGGWTVGTPATFPSTGGNPSWYLEAMVDTFAPQPRSTVASSPFGGDWRAKGVASVGIDLRTLSTQFAFQRELTLMIGNDAGTPADPSDDCIVYFLGTRLVPQVAEGWRSFDFYVDTGSTVLPPGWQLYPTAGGCTSGDAAWNTIVSDVSYVQYFYGDPLNFFIFDIWDVGLDNARISDTLPTSNFCVAKTNSQGCQATIAMSGTPSASSASPFLVDASQVINKKPGMLLYGYAPSNMPFAGGTFCIGGTVRRTTLQSSGGSASGQDCTGTYTYDFNALIQGGGDPLLAVGQSVFVQYWYRDPAAGIPVGLSDAGQFTIQP